MQPDPTLDQMIACAVRELAMRRRAYPRWVGQQRLTQEKADHEIACMEAIARHLQRQQQGDLLG